MKSIKKKNIGLILLFAAALLFGCEKDNPLANKNEKQIELEIIPSNQVLIVWDSTVYQHKTIYSQYDSTYVDSLAIFLKNSKISIEGMWYPFNENTPCLILIRAGSEIIIKLKEPDPSIYKYGFQKNDGGFPINCFGLWRHYKFISKQ